MTTMRTMTTAATEDPRDTEIERAFRELRVVQDRLRQNRRHDAELRRQRRAIYRHLLEDLHVDRAEVGRVAGVTSMAVQFDVYGRDRSKKGTQAEAY